MLLLLLLLSVLAHLVSSHLMQLRESEYLPSEYVMCTLLFVHIHIYIHIHIHSFSLCLSLSCVRTLSLLYSSFIRFLSAKSVIASTVNWRLLNGESSNNNKTQSKM